MIVKRLDKARNGLSPETGGSVYTFTEKAIEQLPQGENVSLNQLLLQAPGAAQDSLGQVHFRGDHGNIQYRIDGIQLPEGINGFAQVISPRFADKISVLTGALPAQYGLRTAGVVDIRTKNGAIVDGGSVEMYGGQRGTVQPSFEYGGTSGNLSYYMTGTYLGTDRGLEPPTLAPTSIHNHADQGQWFGYLSYFPNPETRISFISGLAVNHLQIPANPNQDPQFMLEGVPTFDSRNIAEEQDEETFYNVLSLQGAVGPQIDYQVAAFSRYSQIDFSPDFHGDLIFNGEASHVFRSSFANGLQGDAAYRLTDTHTLRTGFYFSGERAEIDNHAFVFPADEMGMQTSDQPFEITDNTALTAWLYSLYLQDEWRPIKPLTINYGLRWDLSDAFVRAGNVGPRVGAIYEFPTGTTLHAAYAKYFTPPPSELVSTADIQKFQGTTGALPSSQSSPVVPDKSDYVDVGIGQRLGLSLNLGVDSYFKYSQHILDEGQFGTALIFSPFNYAYGRVYGVEATAAYNDEHLSSYANFAYSVAQGTQVQSGQFNFEPDELAYIANHYVFLDHDQTFTASAGLAYRWHQWLGTVDGLYGSGLRSGFANTGNLPYYIQVNTGVKTGFDVPVVGRVDLRLDCVNLFDHTYLIRDGSGIGVGAPQYGPRRAVYAGIRIPLPFTEPPHTAEM